MGADDTSRDLYHWNGRVSTMKTMGYFWFCFTNTKLYYCTDEGAITASLCSMAGLRLRFLLHPPTPTPAQGAPLLAGIACVRFRQSSECLSQPTGWSGLLEDRDCDWSILWVYWPHKGRHKWSEEMAEKSALCVWAGLFPTGACSSITFFGCPHGTQAPAEAASASPPPWYAPPAPPAARSSRLVSCSSSATTGQSEQPTLDPALSVRGRSENRNWENPCIQQEPTGLHVNERK